MSKSNLWVLDPRNLVFLILVSKSEFSTLETDASQHLSDVCHITRMKHWFSELNVSKVTWTMRRITMTGCTVSVTISGAHPRVMNSLVTWFTSSLVENLLISDT